MKILAFGEILYDVFETETKIGGAPLNFAAHFSKLGGNGYVLSAVGDDELGHNALKTACELGVNTKYIAVTGDKTGRCNVNCSNGEPVYDLSMPGAYDNIALPDEASIQKEQFDILYFGTLAQRSEGSGKTLEALLEMKDCFKKSFFDMNIRQAYYSREMIEKSLCKADIVKINRNEFELLKSLGICEDEKVLCKKFSVELLLLTLDKDGMVLYDALNDELYSSGKPSNKLVSAVGAGDGSSACFLYNYLKNESLQACVNRANIIGDYIVTFTEAIPEYSDELKKLLK